MRFRLSLIAFCFLLSCNSPRKVDINESEYARGNNISEKFFDGEVKYFRKKNNTLSCIALFKDNELNGLVRKFDSTGNQVIDLMNYDDNLPNGYHYVYNNSIISYSDFSYYGLYVGPRFYYDSGKLSFFQFTDFNRNIIFHSVYDDKGVKEKSGNPMVYSLNKNLRDGNLEEIGVLLYLINPPKIKITYEIGLIDTLSKKERDVVEYNPNQRVFLDTSLESKKSNSLEKYFIKCFYFDSTNNFNKEYFSIIQ
jgi:hypothetical protein